MLDGSSILREKESFSISLSLSIGVYNPTVFSPNTIPVLLHDKLFDRI